MITWFAGDWRWDNGPDDVPVRAPLFTECLVGVHHGFALSLVVGVGSDSCHSECCTVCVVVCCVRWLFENSIS